MNIRPKPQDSITTELLRQDIKRPIAIPANEQLASETRELENLKGVNLAVTSSDSLKTVLEELSSLRVWATKTYMGKIQDSDKTVVQNRIDMIKNDISQRLSDTDFNKVKRLETDAKMEQGQPMKIKNTALETLGISDFSVLKGSKIEDIDYAINMVNKAYRKTKYKNINKESNKQFNSQKRSSVLSKRPANTTLNKINNVASRSSIIAKFKNVAVAK